LWKVSNGVLVKNFIEHTSGVTSVSFSKDDKYIISGSADKTLKLWNVQTGECLRTFGNQNSPVNSIVYQMTISLLLVDQMIIL
jgi:WD40 repeat protein